jgi:hypothetical protein
MESNELTRTSMTNIHNNILQVLDGTNKIRMTWEARIERKIEEMEKTTK